MHAGLKLENSKHYRCTAVWADFRNKTIFLYNNIRILTIRGVLILKGNFQPYQMRDETALKPEASSVAFQNELTITPAPSFNSYEGRVTKLLL